MTEVESSRTSLASRTDFEVLGLGLGLEGQVLGLASRPQVLENWPVLGSRTALFFGKLKFCGAVEKFFGKRFFVEIAWKIFVKTFFFFGDRLKNFCEDLFFFFFGEHLRFVSLVLGLGLEHSCPWPRECLSSERLSLASDFFCVLGLEPLCPRLHLWLMKYCKINKISGKIKPS